MQGHKTVDFVLCTKKTAADLKSKNAYDAVVERDLTCL